MASRGRPSPRAHFVGRCLTETHRRMANPLPTRKAPAAMDEARAQAMATRPSPSSPAAGTPDALLRGLGPVAGDPARGGAVAGVLRRAHGPSPLRRTPSCRLRSRNRGRSGERHGGAAPAVAYRIRRALPRRPADGLGERLASGAARNAARASRSARDCITGWHWAQPRPRRCPSCDSPRLLTHPELDALSIAHVDCDAFFAAVEKRDDPSPDEPAVSSAAAGAASSRPPATLPDLACARRCRCSRP